MTIRAPLTTLLFAPLAVAGFGSAPLSAGKVKSNAHKHQVPTWSWNTRATQLSWYAARVRGRHRIRLPAKPHLWRRKTVRVTRGGITVARFGAHAETAFVILDDRWLVYSVHHPIATGCALVAYDLKKRRRRWKVQLKGMGSIGHSKYRNHINLRAGPGRAVTVFGWESAGRYVEVRDLRTGKLLHHRKIP